jgi:hypothetical protein
MKFEISLLLEKKASDHVDLAVAGSSLEHEGR